MTLTVRFFAAARAAAGTDLTEIDVPADATLGDLERALVVDHPDLTRVLARCSYLRDAIAVCDRVTREHGVHNVTLLADLYHLAVNGDDLDVQLSHR